MTTPTPIEEVKCHKCKYCKVETMILRPSILYCTFHKLKTQHDNTCKEFKR